MNERPLILISNDDGITAKGIRTLIDILSPLGELLIVAPDGPRSGQSCAITSNRLIYLKPVIKEENITEYSSTGTPTDCVKLAFFELFGKRKPDLIVSGINHGSNAGVCVLYSGTMGAVIEGCLQGIPSIGFSLCSHNENPDFEKYTPYIISICQEMLKNGLPKGICLNVNMPYTPHIKGVKVCRQAKGHWSEEYVEVINDMGEKGYKLTGYFNNFELDAQDTDEWLLTHGYITVVPNSVDMSATNEIVPLKPRFEFSDESTG